MTKKTKNQLKFRVWHTMERRWLKEDEFKINANGEIATYGLYVHASKLIVEQWVGLEDKKKVDIYEGDIIKVDREKRVGEVIRNPENGCFMIRNGIWNYAMYAYATTMKNAIVIGNIHEHKLPSFK